MREQYPMSWQPLSVFDADVARLGEETHGFEAAFATEAGVLDPAHRCAQVAQHPGIHPDQPGFQARRYAVTALDVTAPDRGRESVWGAVRDAQRIVFVAEGLKRRDGTKDLLLVRRAFRLQAVDDSRLVEPALAAAHGINDRALTAAQNLTAVGA